MKKKYLSAILSLLILGVIIGLAIYYIERPSKDYLQGQAEATEIHVAPKVLGRLEKKLVEEGTQVKKGQLLAVLASPELDAKLLQAESAMKVADAENLKAKNGTRSEQVQAAFNQWQQAKAASALAEKTYNRIQNLFDEKVVSAQKRDEAYTQNQASKEQERAAYANYSLAVNGARKEDRQAASAHAKQAEGAVDEVQSYRNEINIISPADAEVDQIIPNVGELVNAGFPVLNLVDLNDIWVVFNIREDYMSNFHMHRKFTAIVPALGNKKVDLEVRYISPLGDFATWNATKTKGDFDLRTFRIKAYPIQKIVGFRPGMSVLVDERSL
jgi:HlyD family secretion protein